MVLPRARAAKWVTAVVFAALTAAIVRAAASGETSFSTARGQDAKTVRLVIDYADGAEKHFTAIPWKEGMTVLDTLQFAASHPHGIKFKHTGSGATAFLTEIDDLKNQGGGSGKKNWIYWVNDQLADRSCGVYELKPSDSVLWRFGKYKPAD